MKFPSMNTCAVGNGDRPIVPFCSSLSPGGSVDSVVAPVSEVAAADSSALKNRKQTATLGKTTNPFRISTFSKDITAGCFVKFKNSNEITRAVLIMIGSKAAWLFSPISSIFLYTDASI